MSEPHISELLSCSKLELFSRPPWFCVLTPGPLQWLLYSVPFFLWNYSPFANNRLKSRRARVTFKRYFSPNCRAVQKMGKLVVWDDSRTHFITFACFEVARNYGGENGNPFQMSASCRSRNRRPETSWKWFLKVRSVIFWIGDVNKNLYGYVTNWS